MIHTIVRTYERGSLHLFKVELLISASYGAFYNANMYLLKATKHAYSAVTKTSVNKEGTTNISTFCFYVIKYKMIGQGCTSLKILDSWTFTWGGRK